MSDTDVITSDEVTSKEPTSFKDLKKAELVAAAQAFGTLDEGNAAELRADLEDAGVTWKMYVKQFKLNGHEDIPEQPELKPREVELLDDEDDEGVEEVSEVVATVEPVPVLNRADKYLIKFIGENPYFEFEQYKVTQEKPYTIMPADAAQRALEQEPKKFRQAFPKELEEFYS